MKQAIWLVGLLLYVAGCGTRQIVVERPGEAVQGVINACKTSDYAKAALYWKDGKETWNRYPDFFRERIETFCSFGRAVDFGMELRREDATQQVWLVTTYADHEHKKGLQIRFWTFERTRGGAWVLAKVE